MTQPYSLTMDTYFHSTLYNGFTYCGVSQGSILSSVYTKRDIAARCRDATDAESGLQRNQQGRLHQTRYGAMPRGVIMTRH